MRMDPRCERLNELSDLYHNLFRQLTERYLVRQSAAFGLREPVCIGDLVLLRVIGDSAGDAVSMSDASRKLGIHPSTATRRATKLVTDGMITKSDAPDDERRYDLRITETGRAFLEKIDDFLFEAVQKTYENVADEEMNVVYGFLEKCISQLCGLVALEKD